ncbi:LamG-like jellyroll fold domain-containing protein [Streptosporangium sp. NPDC000095]|uniref:LamG-like jellyroll fold domain-containing protein n=1 Tax=Streptosporangium sp. NPDC000095 TaxID=3366184 RepID=UPI00368F5DE1
MHDKNLVKVYKDRQYTSTTMVRHDGMVVAFAVGADRHVYYSVLSLDQADRARGALDAAYWNNDPGLLPFPTEMVEVSAEAPLTAVMPTVKRRGSVEASFSEKLLPGEDDPFLSTTARLTSTFPLQVLSDGRHILVFRQSVASGDAGSVYKTSAGSWSGDATRKDYTLVGGAKIAAADSALLCDRFVLVGAELKPVVEARYQRSRSRIAPASGGDTLGTRDMEGRLFYEPTLKLSFAGKLSGGMFSVLSLPTAISGFSRWQVFTADDAGLLHSYNLEQSPEGLFNVAGTQLYTSPDPKFASSVLERAPGIDSHTGKLLVPVRPPQNRGGTALRFDNTASAPVIAGKIATAVTAGPYTMEAWIKPATATTTGLIVGRTDTTGTATPAYLSLKADGKLLFGHGSQTLTSTSAVAMGTYSHVAAVFDGSQLQLFLNGVAAGTLATTVKVEVTSQLLVGKRVVSGPAAADPFNGHIDEVRIWTIARANFSARGQRPTGTEAGLYAYFPFDEGTGTTVYDRGVNKFEGTFATGPVWTDSDAPLFDGPGVSHQSFSITGRKVVCGLTATLYYQQHPAVTGYDHTPSPQKGQARVLLAFATSGPPPTGEPTGRSYLATLDFALSTEGKLATAPAVIDLTWIGTADPTKDSDKLRAAQEAVTAARGQLYNDQALVARIPATLARLGQLDDELHGGIYSMNAQSKVAGPAGNRGREVKARVEAEAAILLPEYVKQLEAKTRLGADKAALETALNTQATLSGGLLGAAEAVLSMPKVCIDRSGLTVLGALLSVAWTTHAPALLDVSTGEVALYFRGGDGQFFAVYYATTISPAVKEITVTGGTLRLSGRDVAMKLADFDVKMTGTGTGTCKVEVSRGTTVETFPSVPDRADLLAAVLNGSARGSTLGTVLSVQDKTVTLTEPLTTTLVAGSAIMVGEDSYTVAGGQSGSAQITLSTAPSTAGTGARVRIAAYDYTLASCNVAGMSLAHGSLLVSAYAGSLTASVPAGTASNLSEPLGPRWHGDAPGRAFSFDNAQKHHLELTSTANISALAAAGNLTLEAWAKPTFVDGLDTILHTDVGDTWYALGVEHGTRTNGESGYVINANINTQAFRSSEVFPLAEWAHLAVSFEQDWAIQMDGTGHLNAGGAGGLDLVDDLTIEAFIKLDSIGAKQGLVGKGTFGAGNHTAVPYCLYVDTDGRLAFTFEPGSGSEAAKIYKSTTALTAGTFNKVAVTRKNPTGTTTEVEICFFINGKKVGDSQWYGGTKPVGNDSPIELGRMMEGKTASGLKGALSEVRIWNVARNNTQIGAPITAKASGLAAWWTFPESKGSQTEDLCGTYPATLHAVSRVRTPDPDGNRFTFYRNGSTVPSEKTASTTSSVVRPTSVRSVVADGFTGDLDEIRAWRTARTQEQILDNMFGRVRGDRQDLLAYYPFDADDTVTGAAVKDAGLSGHHLTQSSPAPKIVLSTAPISTDTAQIRSALTGIRTAFHTSIAATPAATEYGDIQRLTDDSLIGVLKRAYTYLQTDKSWALITGYKVGELTTTWVGQAQFDPQLIGYIEGAPPIPSENLIAGTAGDYAGASSIAFVQADTVVNALSSNKHHSIDTSVKAKFDTMYNDDTWVVAAPLGAGTAKPAASTTVEWGLNVELKYANTWNNETKVSQGTNTTRTSKVTLSGGWEDPDPAKQVNPTAGRRWVPANTGFAVVQSETADLFALRLAHSGALVAYRMLPSPDIPRDWNLIPFPINPRYTKQGTLDGVVGYAKDATSKELKPFADPDFPNAASDGVRGEFSYFRPVEAYRIKKRIQREQQQLQGFYESVSTETHAPDPTHGQAAKVLNGMMGGTGAEITQGGNPEKGRSAIREASRRNIVNTYVWTAAGGFFAETTGTTDQVTETTTGSYTFNAAIGGSFTFGGEIAGLGVKFGMESATGTGYSITRSKSKDSTRTFSLDVSCTPGAQLQKHNGDTPLFDADNKPILVPGRVDAYRFMSLYLDTSTDNFEDFYGKVIDPEWLDRGKDPNALALKRAQQSDRKPPCWRIMHRVTFISRVQDTATTTPSLAQAMGALGITSDYELIGRLQPHLAGATGDFTALSAAAKTALATHFARLAPYAETIVGRLAAYYNLPPDTLIITPTAPKPQSTLTTTTKSITKGTNLTVHYSTPTGTVSAKNWIGLYPVDKKPSEIEALEWAYAPNAEGTVAIPTTKLPGLGTYAAWYLHDNGYTALTGVLMFTVT